MELLLRHWMCSTWEAVMNHPCLAGVRISSAIEVFKLPRHCSGWHIPDLDPIGNFADAASDVALVTQLGLQALRVELVVLALLH